MDFEKLMRLAIIEAKKALKSGDVPVGALILIDDKIISKAYNQVEKNSNAIHHAELISIKKAIKKVGYKHLLNSTLVTTLEPCSMCAGAIVLARISRVIFGAYDFKSGAGGSVLNILNNKSLNHRVELIGGILERECSELIQNFFQNLRNEG
ncbi:MAG: tRNA adenosine(34) deaminase TadA [Candidatus Kapaibacteriales bacterium]